MVCRTITALSEGIIYILFFPAPRHPIISSYPLQCIIPASAPSGEGETPVGGIPPLWFSQRKTPKAGLLFFGMNNGLVFPYLKDYAGGFYQVGQNYMLGVSIGYRLPQQDCSGRNTSNRYCPYPSNLKILPWQQSSSSGSYRLHYISLLPFWRCKFIS